MKYIDGSVIWTPTVKQLVEGHEQSLIMLWLSYEFDPSYVEIIGKEFFSKLTLFIGNMDLYKTTDSSTPAHVAASRLKKNFHPHVLVMIHEEFTRVWVMSTNIVKAHFGLECQEAAWVHDFPRKKITSNIHETKFGRDLDEMLNVVNSLPIEVEAGEPQAQLQKVIALVKSYDFSFKPGFEARLIIAVPRKKIKLKHPRMRLRELITEIRQSNPSENNTGERDQLLIINGFLNECAEFLEFFEELSKLCDANIRIGAATEAEVELACKFKKKPERGLSLNEGVEGSVRHLLCRILYKSLNVKACIHSKIGLLLGSVIINGLSLLIEKACIIGGANYSKAGWGLSDWDDDEPEKEMILPTNFEVSVFLTGSRLPELLRVNQKYANETHEDNRGLGWTLSNGLAEWEDEEEVKQSKKQPVKKHKKQRVK